MDFHYRFHFSHNPRGIMFFLYIMLAIFFSDTFGLDANWSDKIFGPRTSRTTSNIIIHRPVSSSSSPSTWSSFPVITNNTIFPKQQNSRIASKFLNNQIGSGTASSNLMSSSSSSSSSPSYDWIRELINSKLVESKRNLNEVEQSLAKFPKNINSKSAEINIITTLSTSTPSPILTQFRAPPKTLKTTVLNRNTTTAPSPFSNITTSTTRRPMIRNYRIITENLNNNNNNNNNMDVDYADQLNSDNHRNDNNRNHKMNLDYFYGHHDSARLKNENIFDHLKHQTQQQSKIFIYNNNNNNKLMKPGQRSEKIKGQKFAQTIHINNDHRHLNKHRPWQQLLELRSLSYPVSSYTQFNNHNHKLTSSTSAVNKQPIREEINENNHIDNNNVNHQQYNSQQQQQQQQHHYYTSNYQPINRTNRNTSTFITTGDRLINMKNNFTNLKSETLKSESLQTNRLSINLVDNNSLDDNNNNNNQKQTANGKWKFRCPNNVSGFYADLNSDCQAYYHCSGHRREQFRFECPQGTKFNERNSNCDWEDNVDCHQSFDLLRA